jgi:S1-C subfamily serine protease
MSPQEEEPNEPENNNNNNNKEVEESESMRRNVILGSAAVLSSALLGVLVPNYSQAAANAATAANTAYGLDDAETRRIDIFEKTAPSVVFIDTFTEKQDQFSTNAIDVPLGTGTGFVWDKQGHIGE